MIGNKLISRHKITRDLFSCHYQLSYNQSMSLNMENSSLEDIELKVKIFSQTSTATR